jgi:hypothetical protein
MARKSTEVKVRITGESRGAEQPATRTEGSFKRLTHTIKESSAARVAVVAVVCSRPGLRALVERQQDGAERGLSIWD